MIYNVDFISQTSFISQEALLISWKTEADQEDYKERSPTMRHVSRTHRVALDWLLDRTNLDP